MSKPKYRLPVPSNKNKKDRLDFEQILWNAVESMRKAMLEGDDNSFINSLSSIEILMTSRITGQSSYSATKKKISSECETECKLARTNKDKIRAAVYKRNMAWARALMRLIDEAGYLPEEEMEIAESTS